MQNNRIALVDQALDLVHSLGVTPADLLIRQREIAQNESPESPESFNENEINNNYIYLDSEKVPGPAAELIEEVSTGDDRLQAAGIQRLWQDFRAFNLRKGKHRIELKALRGFLRVWEDRLKAFAAKASRNSHAPRSVPSRPAVSPRREASPGEKSLIKLSSPAPSANRWYHRNALERLLGPDGYQARIAQAMKDYACGAFSAALVVHGMAVSAGEITP